MIIREYQSSDCKELTQLFYNTVHTVNSSDYTKEQLDVWANGNVDLDASITARPFFEKRGYKVIKEQQVEKQGIFLTNFVMEKNR